MPPLWLGCLLPFVAWLIELQAVYAATHWSCMHDKGWVLHLIHIIALVLAIGGAVVCLFYWRSYRNWPNEADRTKFLASLGLFTSTYVTVAMIAQIIATTMLDPCFT
jgi:hypothetical protein